MPKTRLESANKVRDAYNAAKVATIDTAIMTARCASVMMEEHATSRLRPEQGARVIHLVGEAANHARIARQLLLDAHHELKGLPSELGFVLAAGIDETYPDEPGNRGALVAAPVMAGVTG